MMQRSANHDGSRFLNAEDTAMSTGDGSWNTAVRWFTGPEKRRPSGQIPVQALDSSAFEDPPPDGLRVTWFGHSTVLVEIDGQRLLTDPVFGKRVSPSRLVGPSRFHAPPMAREDLPRLDAVLISHDHFDHLEKDSVTALAETGVTFVVPLGVADYLACWGVDPSQIKELDWDDEVAIGGVRVLAVPSRHFSGRGPGIGMNSTLWTSYALLGPGHRVFYSGDTGPTTNHAAIGEELGPFDLTLIESGAWDRNWSDIHMGPDGAVQAHQELRGELFMPVHWGTFNLALHGWDEPARRITELAGEQGVKVTIPAPGQMVTVSRPPQLDPWWEAVD